MNNMYRRAKGYLKVITLQDSPERFFNLCRARNILLWNIAKNDDCYSFYISIYDFRKLKDILRKTKMKVRIIKRFGLPFFVFRYRKHYSFVIGIMLSMIMIYVMSLFVWDISFDGNYTYTDNVMMSYLTELNITPGILVSKISCDALETNIRKTFNDISWVSAEISGTKLIVHIKENDLSIGNETISNDEPCDIIADRAGKITKIITRNGTPRVKIGDEVTEGQVLVSGEVIVYNDAKEAVKSNYVKSDADIYIDTKYDYMDELKIEHQYKIYTGRSVEKKIYNILGKQLELGISFKRFHEYDIVTEDSVMKLTNNFYLPIRIGEKTYFEYDVSQGEYTIEEGNDILYENYAAFLKKLQEKGIQTIDSSVKINVLNDRYVMSGIVYVNQVQNACMPIDVTKDIPNENPDGIHEIN